MNILNPYFINESTIKRYKPMDKVVVPFITIKFGDSTKSVMSGIAYKDKESAKSHHMWFKQPEKQGEIDLIEMKVIDFLKKRSKVSYSLNDGSKISSFIELYQDFHNVKISEKE